jgi:signal transduction histidine kinase/CheY-like chemotaxis protein/HPt (histidine-containing phosphotransfer) domain-containing protein
MSIGGFRITAPPLWLVLALPLVFFATGALSLYAFGATSPIWVSNAFVVVALLRNERSTWPVLLFLAAAADFAASAVTGIPRIGLGFAACDTGEILLVALLSSPHAIVLSDFGIWPKARFAVVCLVVPLLSASAGASLISLAYGTSFIGGWKIWYCASTCGLLTVASLLLTWTDPTFKHQSGPILQTILLSVLVAGVGYIAFTNVMLGLYLVFPFLLFVAFTGGLPGTTAATAVLSAVAIWRTLEGHGPIAEHAASNPVLEVQLLQLFLATVLICTVPVAAILDQREKLTAQREKLMAQLQETTIKAEAASQAKSEFMAVMSHEIRTPMTGVLGMADLLLNEELSEKSREYVRGIHRSGRHLLALINDILDFSRAEAKKLDLETIDFDLQEVFEQVRSLLAPQAAERGLALSFEHDAQTPLILRGDPTRIKQVLVNLVGNGLKFTQRGGVTVTVHHRTTKEGRDHFRFEVRDTGIGIPAEKQAILFTAFSQMDASTTRQYGGSGLGLAICKKLVDAMGGAIGVDSVTGMGSLFWFELPLERGQSMAPAAEQRVLVPGPPRRVLLVEDVELNQVLIADMLQAHGHKVTIAGNGLEAVTLAARERFEVVLMDVQMPVMDGVEATRQIRRLPPPARDVPILALSANVIPEDRNRYLMAGMNGALPKPIDWPQLFEAITRYAPPEQSAETSVDVAKPAGIAAAPLPPTTPPLDEAVFDRVRHAQGKTGDLAARLVDIFVRDTAQRLDELRDATQRADAPAVARMAHAIRGSAANLGVQIMADICATIEANAQSGDLGPGLARIDALQCEFIRARGALAAKLTTA